MIKVINLTKKIKNKVILEGINFSIDKGNTVAIFGENGSGKTSLIKILSGYDVDFEGNFLIDNNIRIAYVPEKVTFFPELAVNEFLDYFSLLKNVQNKQFIEELGLNKYYNYPIKKLSKGYLQRLNIAQAIIDNPNIIFFDEPDNGIDAFTLYDIKYIILKMKTNRIMFISSHNFDFLYDICDFFLILKKGKLIFYGYKRELLYFLMSKIKIVSFNKMFKDSIKRKLCNIKYEVFSSDDKYMTIIFEKNKRNIMEFNDNIDYKIKREQHIDDRFLLKLLKFYYEKLL